MNQKGNEPMTMLHAYIPVKLKEQIDASAARAGVNKSEYIRLSLEYIQENRVRVVQKLTFRDE